MTAVESGDLALEGAYMLSLVPGDRSRRVLSRVLDGAQSLSPFGVRSLSRHHADHPDEIEVRGEHPTVDYVPGEGDGGMLGGYSNWPGPASFPISGPLYDSLEPYHAAYGEGFGVERPMGNGRMRTP